MNDAVRREQSSRVPLVDRPLPGAVCGCSR